MMDKRISIPELGKRISHFRKKKLLTQKELGNRLDISDKTISKWEKGTVAPDITILESLAKVLEVKLDDLLVVNNEEIKIKRKRTISSSLILIFLFVVISFSGFSYYKENDNNKWIAHELVSLNDQYIVEGYLLINDMESRIVFTRLAYKFDSFEVGEVRFDAFCDEKNIYHDNIISNDVININDFLFKTSSKKDIKLDKVDYNLIKNKKLFIKLFYKDKKFKDHNDRINVGFK